jgi:hypothetical protein
MVCEWFDLKTTRTISHRFGPQNRWRRFVSGLASKPIVLVYEWFDLKTTRTVFTGLASKPVRTVSSSLASKHAVTVFVDLASKPVVTVSVGLASKPAAMVFVGLASKPVAAVSLGLASKLVVAFLVEPQNQGGGGFSGLVLKTDSSSLMIWTSKSPRRFLGLGLKTKWAYVCQLHHKTDGGRSERDTCRDLAACFTWKQVWLGFPSLA